MDQINKEVLKVIDEQHAIRIVADIPTDVLRSGDYLTSASDFIKPFVKEWESKHMTRLLVVDVYPRHTYVVVDINNHQYDYDTAHKQTFTVPVYILRLSRRDSKWAFFRRAIEDQRLAATIAELHRCNGYNPLPFLADHIQGSVYLSPRTT
ncbi:hypothetical protein PRK78_001630 [Emydomyces testavorans]|uniref:Uncharacterized protein n=1 Tax=Emydomyces testavorans TaxID=2070801 RepID=A0AAF0DD80_9EURO|nr:hypothetical protein PRK78_001630 [Emydomyces testavorans]